MHILTPILTDAGWYKGVVIIFHGGGGHEAKANKTLDPVQDHIMNHDQ